MEGKTLTQGAPWRSNLSFMFPVFMGFLLQQLYNTVDTIVVGNFSGEAKEKILDTDMLVFVTPLYYFGMSTQLKMVMFRPL